MIYAGRYWAEINPSLPQIPYGRIVYEWKLLKFAAESCKWSLDRIISEEPGFEQFFNPRELLSGGFGGTDNLHYGLYDQSRYWDWELSSGAAGTGPSILKRVETSELPSLGAFVRSWRDGDLPHEEFRATLKRLGADPLAVDVVLTSPEDEAPDAGRWMSSDLPGMYRREHASLVFRSDTTTVVVDPQVLSGTWTTNHGRYPAGDLTRRVDAVLITHHHQDHWHIPSILYLTRPDTPVIVPDVPRPNMLCWERFTDTLAAVGQAAIVGEWDSTITVGDIEIDVLPFRGEQPTKYAPGPPPDLRNWGNCYRINTPHFSAVILADSGVDPTGDICPSLEASVKKRGPVDFLLCNCRTFPEGINMGNPHYSLALPFDRLQQIFADREKGRIESMTLGPSGIAGACAAAQARYFLPYAQGFRGIGVDPVGDPSEASILAEVEEEMRHRSPGTQVTGWYPGSSVTLDARGRLLERAFA
ncbi:MAG TPA: MBL fold metallo-hydrolase [Streptosporangiaceae bacterium]|jgi:L-ascorbate metabolism protein UlaG (beta-lactamase superfamily)